MNVSEANAVSVVIRWMFEVNDGLSTAGSLTPPDPDVVREKAHQLAARAYERLGAGPRPDHVLKAPFRRKGR